MNLGLHHMLLAQASTGNVLDNVTLLFFLLVLVLYIASGWRLFTKANRPGWAFLVPFYDLVVKLRISGNPAWWLLLLFIPIVNIPIWVIMNHGLSRAFGKGVGYTLGLLFLPWFFVPLLAFGNATYLGAEPRAVSA